MAMTSEGVLKFSEIYAWGHRDFEVECTFRKITTGSTSLFVTAKHLVAIASNHADSLEYVLARDVKVGDIIYVMDGDGSASTASVTSVSEEVKPGLFAPLTMEGTILVNGVVASCYSEVPLHYSIHAALAPLRMLYRTGASPLLQKEGGYLSHTGKHMFGSHEVVYAMAKVARMWLPPL